MAAAESPVDLVGPLSEDGVYVAPGRTDVIEEAVVTAVEDVRFEGLRMVVVAPNDPQPDPASFARRVQEQTAADVAIVFPAEGPMEAYVIDDLSSSRLRAIDAGRSTDDPAQAVRAFAAELMTEPVQSTPPIFGRLITIGVLLTLALAAVVALEQVVVRNRRQQAGGGREKPVTNRGRVADSA